MINYTFSNNLPVLLTSPLFSPVEMLLNIEDILKKYCYFPCEYREYINLIDEKI